MTTEKKLKLVTLGQQLSTIGTEFRLAQIGLEHMAEKHGLSSPQAVEASQLCSDLALRFTQLEDEFFDAVLPCSLLAE